MQHIYSVAISDSASLETLMDLYYIRENSAKYYLIKQVFGDRVPKEHRLILHVLSQCSDTFNGYADEALARGADFDFDLVEIWLALRRFQENHRQMDVVYRSVEICLECGNLATEFVVNSKVDRARFETLKIRSRLVLPEFKRMFTELFVPLERLMMAQSSRT